jgi:hypothetical protein
VGWDQRLISEDELSELMWYPQRSYHRLSDCEDRREKVSQAIDIFTKEYGRQTGSRGPNLHSSVCLPDTVDPRGPKGK